MRLILGILIGIGLTLGAAYLHDMNLPGTPAGTADASQAAPDTAGRPVVNWEVLAAITPRPDLVHPHPVEQAVPVRMARWTDQRNRARIPSGLHCGFFGGTDVQPTVGQFEANPRSSEMHAIINSPR